MTQAEDWSKDRLGYQFADLSLLEQALTHRSAKLANNERLEFLGDAVLGFVIAQEVFLRKPDAPEGAMSRFRAHLVRRDTLAELARELQLGDQVQLGDGERRTGGHQRTSVLADALEALFGSVLLDGGIEAVAAVIRKLFATRLENLPTEAELLDAKTALQELLQARGLGLPVYTLEGTSGASHSQTFTVSCVVDAFELSTQGQGNSRRKAEQKAAAKALENLQHADK